MLNFSINFNQLTGIIEITLMNGECRLLYNSRVVNSMEQYFPVFAGIYR